MASYLTQNTIQESKTLWIGDIESWMDETYLANMFENIGIASIKIIRDKNTKLPVGYGFIEFTSHQLAQQILAMYNGRQIPGTMKTFRLNWGIFGGGIKPTQLQPNNPQPAVQQQQPVAAPQPAARSTSILQQDYQIYVGDIDPSINDQGLYDFFHQKYQTVIGAKIIIDPATKYSKGYGFVKFSNFEDSQRAIKEFHGAFFKGRYLKCSTGVRKTDNPADVNYNTALASINTGIYNDYSQNYANTYDQTNYNYYNNYTYGGSYYDIQGQQDIYSQYGMAGMAQDPTLQYYQASYPQYYQQDPQQANQYINSQQQYQIYQNYGTPNQAQQAYSKEENKLNLLNTKVNNQQVKNQEFIDENEEYLLQNFDYVYNKIQVSIMENNL